MNESKMYPLPGPEVEEREEELVGRWLAREEGGSAVLSAEEESRAGAVVRRLRLAERLLTDVLDLGEGDIAPDACRMEHVLSPGAADAICTLLGHPRSCPHGKAVPRGACCEGNRDTARALLLPLDRMSAGEEGRVAYLLSPDSPDAQRLLSMGLVPGTPVRLEQVRPAFVVTAGANTVAMESAVAGGIVVRVGRGGKA
ncbi:MAG: DtxR family transcriptional regulator, Mn-dependent transcriptional regulator [Elusimicrobia bacterium]|nr:MAG: DtxR family transcriptional regulator, Mn-dependent transcriptional regulator [Elusimicrobiota bacterium]